MRRQEDVVSAGLIGRRFLRARKFQLDPAYDQFKGTEQWRETNRIKELYETIDVTEYDETRKLVSRLSDHLTDGWQVAAKGHWHS